MVEIKGKTVEDILRMDQADWARLNRSDLAKAVRILSAAANKRLKAFEAAGEYTPASQAAKRSGGSFSTKGKNRNQLQHEFARAKSFLTAETSTLKGWKAVKQRTIDTFERQTGVRIPYDKFNDFWAAYEKLRDLDPDIVNRAIKYQVMDDLVQKLLDGQDVDKIVADMHSRISQIYEETQEHGGNGGTAKYFSGQ